MRIEWCTFPFIGLRALGLLIPARVFVVIGAQVLAHLEGGEHAAHFDGAIRAFASHHGEGVVGQWHFHGTHIAHAALAHQHVVGHDFLDLAYQTAVVHTNHGGHVVAHGTHGVVALVAVKGPVTGLVSHKVHLPHLAHRHVCCHLGPARSPGCGATVCACHLELMTVEMDGVVSHGQVAYADAYPVALLGHHGCDGREGTAVERPDVEVRHLVDARRHGARLYRVGAQQESVVTLNLINQGVLAFGMGDPQPHHAHGHLHHFVGVRVVHEGAGAAR